MSKKTKCLIGFHSFNEVSKRDYHILGKNSDVIGYVTLKVSECANCGTHIITTSNKAIFEVKPLKQ